MSFSECGDGEKPTVTVDDNGRYNIKVSNIRNYMSPADESITQIDGGVKLENESVLIPELSRTIAQLMMRVAALEGMIRNEEYTQLDGSETACVVWKRKIGSGSGDFYNEKFVNKDREKAISVVPDIYYSEEAIVDPETGVTKETFGAGIMEIGNVIDFHVPNGTGEADNTEGGIVDHTCCPGYGYGKKSNNIPAGKTYGADYCARIYVDRNNTLHIRANGIYFQPLNDYSLKRPIMVQKSAGESVPAEMNALKNGNVINTYYADIAKKAGVTLDPSTFGST